MLSSLRKFVSSTTIRQIGTKTKLIGELEEHVLKSIEKNELNPKLHPGKIKPVFRGLPYTLENAIKTVLKDQQLQQLHNGGKNLDRYLKGRHPPPSPEEKHQKSSRKVYNWQPINYDTYKGMQYLVGRIDPDYAILTQVLQELKTRIPEFSPEHLFDFGSGIGTVSWSVNSLWRDSLKEIFCVDVSGDMNNLAELLLRGGQSEGHLPIPGIFFRQFLPVSKSRQYDLVVSAFSLFELPSKEDRLNTILNLWNKTKKFLVLVEQGTNASFKLIDEAKEFVLYVSKNTSESAYTFAPCPHDEVCPRLQAEDGTPCNFEVKYPNSFMKRENDFQRDRFSYVILGKGVRPPNTPTWPRIIRPTLKRKKHLICRLCTSDGNLQEIVMTKRKDGSAPYQCAKASKWGDLLPISLATKTFPSRVAKSSGSSSEDTDSDTDQTPHT